MKSKSLLAFYFAALFMAGVSFFYYPKWKQPGTEATISWDVSGYYWYLPAIFIYKDITQLKFNDSILQKYQPVPFFAHAFPYKNGNYVMKYSSGMAVQYLPFFLAAHALAPALGYEADGFSEPYQFAIQLEGLLFAILGLWFFRKILLLYFKEETVVLTILLYVLGTNYLNFASIDIGMTHSWLFTWYCILIYYTHHFYQKPTFKYAAIVGACLGIMALTRPTEIIAVIIPLLWGISNVNKNVFLERWKFIQTHFSKYLLASVIMGAIGFIQLAYWKYASGDWLVYSYQDQGFDWTHPHIRQYMISYRCGWLVYTPMMLFAFIGLAPFIKRKQNVIPVILFILLNTYIVVSWSVWWYGGRAMVQSYALLAFPLAAFIEYIHSKQYIKYPIYAIFALFCYYNLWWTHQVHRGGLVDPYEMTRAYFWKVLLKYKDQVPPEAVKLYDTHEEFNGERKNVKLIYENDFESDSSLYQSFTVINGRGAIHLDANKQSSKTYEFPVNKGDAKWLRASATFRINEKEWDIWKMAQMKVTFYNKDQVVKENSIKLHRLLDDYSTKQIFIDVKLPKKPFDHASVVFWNAGGQKPMVIDDVQVEIFEE